MTITKSQTNITYHQDISIRLRQVGKVYLDKTTNSQHAHTLMQHGASRTHIIEQTGITPALYDINLDIIKGQIHCIMGLSGSGKSTLIRLINRLHNVTVGQIWVNGLAVSQMDKPKLRQFRQQQLAMVFQHFGLIPHMTILQNVSYGLRVRGVSKSIRHDVARHWLYEVGLNGIEQKYPNMLSGGMRQRVGLARALAMDTPVILMDEAFSALDPLIRHELQQQLLELQNKLHKTVVFITHDIDEALILGNQISILNQGELIQTGNANELQNHPNNDYVARFLGKN